MPVRYGVALIPEPSFTARVYRVRQLVCGQYASWAAEMHPVCLALADYFGCADGALEPVCQGLSGIAEASRARALRFPLLSRGAAACPDLAGHIRLDFTVSENPRERHQLELNDLHRQVISLLEQIPDAFPDLRSVRENFRPHIPLLQYAQLPPAVFDSALEFARVGLRDLQVPNATRAWEMALLRFESDAAGEDWDNGRWAPDLRWRFVSVFAL